MSRAWKLYLSDLLATNLIKTYLHCQDHAEPLATLCLWRESPVILRWLGLLETCFHPEPALCCAVLSFGCMDPTDRVRDLSLSDPEQSVDAS